MTEPAVHRCSLMSGVPPTYPGGSMLSRRTGLVSSILGVALIVVVVAACGSGTQQLSPDDEAGPSTVVDPDAA